MPHRLSALSVFGLLLATAAFATPARAQVDGPLPVPADAPTVATTPSGAAILAWVKGGRTCTALQAPGAARPTRITTAVGDPRAPDAVAGSCDTTPTLSRFDGELGGTYSDDDGRTFVWGMAGAETARIVLKRGTTVLAQAGTAPAALPGAAAGLRFWAADRANAPEPDEIAFLDAAGVVRRAEAWAGSDGSSPSGRAGSGTLLQHGRVGDARWELRRTTSSQLAGTPLQPERRVIQHCTSFVTMRVRDGAHSNVSESGACDGTNVLAAVPMLAAASSDCALGTHVEVFASAAVRRAVVVLGDGSRRAVPLVAFGGGPRVGVAVIGFGKAVRHVLALGAGGHVLRSAAIGAPPGVMPRGAFCSSSASIGFGGRAGADPDRLGPAPHAVRSVDHGLELCTAIDRAPRIPLDCGLPPTDPTLSPVLVRRTADGQFAYGVLPEDVASVRLRLADGSARTTPTTPLTDYTGIYAGVLRQVALDLPGGVTAERAEMLDDRGRVLSRNLVAAEPELGRPVTLRPAGGGVPVVRAAPFDLFGQTGACIALGPLEALDDCDDVAYTSAEAPAYTVRVVATCAPRRLLVTAILPRRTDRLVARTTRGREVVARAVRIPPAAGVTGHYAIAVLGPRDGLDAALVRGRAARRVPIDLPPTAEQCGYAAAPGLFARLAPAGG